jgi:hypothetical protein
VLLGYCLRIYTDYENLLRLTAFSKFLCIQTSIEEICPAMLFNLVADALSRLDADLSSTSASSKQIAKVYETRDKSLQDFNHPSGIQTIVKHQCIDQMLMQH